MMYIPENSDHWFDCQIHETGGICDCGGIVELKRFDPLYEEVPGETVMYWESEDGEQFYFAKKAP